MPHDQQLIKDYFEAINAVYKTGDASEYSYRSALENLLNGLLSPTYKAINEPRHVDCGRPDIAIVRAKDGVTVTTIETKDIGKPDLEGRGRNQEQFDRYKRAMNHVVFTDYLRFIFYEGGSDESTADIRIGEIRGGKAQPRMEESMQLIGELRGSVGASIQPIRTSAQLADLMARKSKLMSAIIADILNKESNDDDAATGLLRNTMNNMKNALIGSLNADSFAKVYSQTVAYGLFAARLHDDTPDDFTRAEAAELIPRTNMLLRGIFNELAGNTIHERILWIVDDMVGMFAATNLQQLFETDIKRDRDPLIHFYEDFLKAFSPEDKIRYGVWYTPLQVVRFIVRAVDAFLKKHLGIHEGLADTKKKTLHSESHGDLTVERVQILDPAVGTGTFLAEVVNLVADSFQGQQTLWQKYVHESLLPRLYGFEIQMASYTVAHVKLDLALAHTGYKLLKNDRFHICLTDALLHKEAGAVSTGHWISKEQEEADTIKLRRPIMVMLGNPPYNGESENKGEEIEKLIEAYKQEPQEGGGRIADTKWLNNDYVKFIALAQSYIEQTGEGIIGFINPNSYLESRTFRGMRFQLLRAFNDIYVVNLHGSAKTHERCPDGSRDDNVFDIEPGVCINLFVRRSLPCEAQKSKPLAHVHYIDLYGRRSEKLAELERSDIGKMAFTEVTPSAPMYYFAPIERAKEDEYNEGFMPDDLFIKRGLGMRTHRDNIAYQFTEEKIKAVVKDFHDLTEEGVKAKYGIERESRDQKVRLAQNNVRTSGLHADNLRKALYRPFDVRHTYFTNMSKGFIVFPVFDVMQHLTHKDTSKNLGLIVGQSGQVVGDMPWNLCFATDTIVDLNIFYRGGGYVYPLYVKGQDNIQQGEATQTTIQFDDTVPNLNESTLLKIADSLGFRPTPEQLFYYIYAILHSPCYRETYKEFLKRDFPRIPYPTNKAHFLKLDELGENLCRLHLMQGCDEWGARKLHPLCGNGGSVVGQYEWSEGKVWINGGSFFNNVPREVFDFYIGGYQPASKWLKDRRNKELTFAELEHYSNIIHVLQQTIELQKKIDMIVTFLK